MADNNNNNNNNAGGEGQIETQIKGLDISQEAVHGTILQRV